MYNNNLRTTKETRSSVALPHEPLPNPLLALPPKLPVQEHPHSQHVHPSVPSELEPSQRGCVAAGSLSALSSSCRFFLLGRVRRESGCGGGGRWRGTGKESGRTRSRAREGRGEDAEDEEGDEEVAGFDERGRGQGEKGGEEEDQEGEGGLGPDCCTQYHNSKHQYLFSYDVQGLDVGR
jgi:hypothetical protein